MSFSLFLLRRLQILTMLIVATGVCTALLAIRVYITGSHSFLFLLWNLFLAWVPFSVAWLLEVVEQQRRLPVALYLSALSFWLLFFPNAPYILTDFVHLRQRPPVPLWFDLSVLLSFAWTGLTLGLVSLRLVQNSIQKRLGTWFGRFAVCIAVLLGGFGIYLGRFERWNSWDILLQTDALMASIVQRITDPLAHPKAFAVTAVFAVFLSIAYGVLLLFYKGTASVENKTPQTS